jgi:hypothetical protein
MGLAAYRLVHRHIAARQDLPAYSYTRRCNADRSKFPIAGGIFKLNNYLATWDFCRQFPAKPFGVMLRALQVGRNMPVGLPPSCADTGTVR